MVHRYKMSLGGNTTSDGGACLENSTRVSGDATSRGTSRNTDESTDRGLKTHYSLRELDVPYLDAVEHGDMEAAQRMVMEAAKLAMPNTKVVDENGNPKVLYDDPKKVQKKSATGKAEECTTNTDAVDREIEKLKEEKRQLEQQIQAETDDEKVKELEKKLAQVEAELNQKNNDTYRRQNAVVS